MDCDGVLTDGRLYFTAAGESMKVFHARDGQGLASWHRAGFESGIISGRGSAGIIRERADELGIRYVYTNSVDKVADLRKIADEARVSLDEVTYIGDDIGDIEAMKAVGLAVAVADAADGVTSIADYVTKKNGGRGAVRELIDLLMRASGK